MSLKDVNKVALFAVLVANLVAFLIFVRSGVLFSGGWTETLKAVEGAVPAGLGLIIVGVLNALLPPEWKARLIFLRWEHPLPGSEAFTRYALLDSRIDFAELEKKHGPLPVAPSAQNSLWYKMFKSVESDDSVSHVHREFLFTRDYATLSLMMLLVLGAAAWTQVGTGQQTFIYIGLLGLQFVFTLVAARNHGRRFVTTVLALKSAGR